jgi:hypothetical protein
MPQVTTIFTPAFVTTMRRALDVATDRVPVPSRTPATKAKMAQRIVRSAHEGITDPQTARGDSGGRGHGASAVGCASAFAVSDCAPNLGFACRPFSHSVAADPNGYQWNP